MAGWILALAAAHATGDTGAPEPATTADTGSPATDTGSPPTPTDTGGPARDTGAPPAATLAGETGGVGCRTAPGGFVAALVAAAALRRGGR